MSNLSLIATTDASVFLDMFKVTTAGFRSLKTVISNHVIIIISGGDSMAEINSESLNTKPDEPQTVGEIFDQMRLSCCRCGFVIYCSKLKTMVKMLN